MRTRRIVAYMLGSLGVVLVLAGLGHVLGGLPLVMEANKPGAINLPSFEDVGIGFHLAREPVLFGLLTVGVDRCLFGVILLLCVADLKSGRKVAWRICLAVGLLISVGYMPFVWIVFEHVHMAPLVMPAIGVLILVPLLLGRHSFTVE